ncbi:MAG: hypothetical protein ACFFB0_03790 [Promethearchaeota archaeon]
MIKELNKKIENIRTKVLSGEISLLDIELVPIFEYLKDSLTVDNIDKYSKTYQRAFTLLNEKFEEFKILLNHLDNENVFIEFLKSKPKDKEIYGLLKDCWRQPFTIHNLSINFLKRSKDKLSSSNRESFAIEIIERMKVKNDFFLEVPTQKFTEKMLDFFDAIKRKLPCPFDDVFKDEKDQIKIYEKFVFILHLLQLGSLKYQKESNFLYL